MVTTGRRVPTALTLLVAVVVSVALAATIVRVAGAGCEWGTFAYRTWMQTPQGEEGPAAVVLVEDDERVLFESTPDGEKAIVPTAMELSPNGEEVALGKIRTTLNDEYAIHEPVGTYIYDIDGTNERRISKKAWSMLDWSPDGELLAFSQNRAIKVVDTDGGDRRTIFRLPRSKKVDPPLIFDPLWSGDSERIAFVIERFGPKQRSEIWTMSSDGSERKRHFVVDYSALGLAWAPDGSKFAWEGAYEGELSVVIGHVSSGDISQVEPNAEDPIWSRDGEQLAYVIAHEGHYDPRIVVGDQNGQGEEALPVPDDAVGIDRLDDWVSC